MRLSTAQVHALKYWALPYPDRFDWARSQPKTAGENKTWVSLQRLGLLTKESTKPQEEIFQLTQEGWRELRRREVLAPKAIAAEHGKTDRAAATPEVPEFHSHHRAPNGDGVPCLLGLWHEGPCEPIGEMT